MDVANAIVSAIRQGVAPPPDALSGTQAVPVAKALANKAGANKDVAGPVVQLIANAVRTGKVPKEAVPNVVNAAANIAQKTSNKNIATPVVQMIANAVRTGKVTGEAVPQVVRAAVNIGRKMNNKNINAAITRIIQNAVGKGMRVAGPARPPPPGTGPGANAWRLAFGPPRPIPNGAPPPPARPPRPSTVLGVPITTPTGQALLVYIFKITNSARKNSSKTDELMKYLKNVKARLGNNSKIKQILNSLYVNGGELPTNNAIRTALRNGLGNMRLMNLLEARKVLKGRDVDQYLLIKVREEIDKINRLNSQQRGWRLNELYKSLPSDFDAGRRLVERAILEEIRRAANRDPSEARRRLEYLRSNINFNRLPTRLRDEFRLLESRTRRGRENNYGYGRRRYENNYGYGRRREEGLRQGPERGRQGPPSRNGGPLVETRGPNLGLPEMGGGGTNALPPNQKNAINRAGGVNAALKTIAQVPGGAPEVARAAADLNETNGNTQKAIIIRGTRPAAIAAVRSLGGPRAAAYALEGLNTLSQTAKTQRRKATSPRKKKAKKSPVRIAELNRVINAVKKTRLVGLVARNVTKGPRNAEHLKPYYKRVIKSNILRRPFAKIVRQAAKAKKN